MVLVNCPVSFSILLLLNSFASDSSQLLFTWLKKRVVLCLRHQGIKRSWFESQWCISDGTKLVISFKIEK